MKYYVNPASLCAAFTLPAEVVDRHIKMAGAVQLKVLLYIFRNLSGDISPVAISSYLSVSEADVCDAVRFWADAGVLVLEGDTVSAPAAVKTQKPAVKAGAVKPTRTEVAKRGTEDPQIAFLLSEAEVKFGRALRQNEASTLVYLYDDEGLSAEILLMLIEFAVSQNKVNIGYIERTATSWIDSGVETVADAERKINEIYLSRSCWHQLESVFGIEHRQPSEREQKLALLWVGEWKMPKELLREAYNRCVDNTGKFSMSYIKTVLEKWHKAGVKSAEDIPDDRRPQKKPDGYAAYDTELFESMLNAIDEG